MSIALRALMLAILLMTPFAAASQTGEAAARSVLEEAKRASISEADLSWHVVALTATELEDLAHTWQGHLRRNLERVVLLETDRNREDASTREALSDLNRQIDETMDKYWIVLAAWGRKGGDAAQLSEHRAFMLGTVAQIMVSANLPTLLRYLVDWLTSWRGGLSVVFDVVLAVSAIGLIYIVARFFRRRARVALERSSSVSALRTTVLVTATFWATILIGVYATLIKLGFSSASVAALFGGTAFLVGLAMQTTLGNIACGLLIGVFRPFDLGDFIKLGALSGTVEQVGLSATRIRRPDNVIVRVPNEEIWRTRFANFTEPDILRVDLVFNIGMPGDERRAIDLLQEVVRAHPKTLEDPATEVFVGEIGEGSIGVYCRPWVTSPDYWRTAWDLKAQGKSALEAAGLKLAYPVMDVRLEGQSDLEPPDRGAMS